MPDPTLDVPHVPRRYHDAEGRELVWRCTVRGCGAEWHCPGDVVLCGDREAWRPCSVEEFALPVPGVAATAGSPVVAYQGRASCRVVQRVHADETRTALRARLDLRRHGPSGYAWGYGGSGPAQLALAICADHLRDDLVAQRVYQEFKARVVVGLPGEGDWTLAREDVAAAVAAIRQEVHDRGERELREAFGV